MAIVATKQSKKGDELKKALVADDTDDVRQMAVTFMATLGYNAIGARNGNEAIKLLGEHPDTEAILTDLEMGSGAGGLDVLFAGSKLASKPMMVLMSGNLSPEIIEDARTIPGVRGCLRKPFRIGDLETLLFSAKPVVA